MNRRNAVIGSLSAALLVLGAAGAASAQWTTAQMLNDPSENSGAIKEPAICPAASGGFHVTYRYFAPNGVRLQYRRYLNGSLSAIKNPPLATGTIFGGDICEAGNGDIHVVFEDWNGTLSTGWTKSSDGGLTWLPYQEITAFGDVGKIPQIAHFGPSNGGEVVMNVGKPNGKDVWYNHYRLVNGTWQWNGFGADTGHNYGSEYELGLMARSLFDGSVYRLLDDGDWVSWQRYNGTNWTTTHVEHTGFFARASIAVNPAGQVMATWEKDNAFSSRVYTPGSGMGPVQMIAGPEHSNGHGGYGMVSAFPDNNDFYAVYVKDTNRVRGRRWSNGSWLAEEVVSVGQTPEFTVNAQVCTGPGGWVYACWEYWGSGDARAWYSVRTGVPPAPTGTVSGIVRDQYGVVVSGAAVSAGVAATVTGAGGAYSLALPAGNYSIGASKDYYTGQTVNSVAVTAGQTTPLDLMISGNPPAPVSEFAASGGNESIQLSWRNASSAQAQGTLIRYRTDGYPAGPQDGTLLINKSTSPNTLDSVDHSNTVNGVTYYYRAFAYYTDASAHYSAPAAATGVSAVRADYDRDGDVDISDFGHFQICLTGSSIAQPDPACLDTRLDADADVDQNDFGIFQNCMSGPNVYAEPSCAD
ncbi:MAG: hypothetical protein AMXMBFR13_26800 [Phycisphaerae bacterium]